MVAGRETSNIAPAGAGGERDSDVGSRFCRPTRAKGRRFMAAKTNGRTDADGRRTNEPTGTTTTRSAPDVVTRSLSLSRSLRSPQFFQRFRSPLAFRIVVGRRGGGGRGILVEFAYRVSLSPLEAAAAAAETVRAEVGKNVTGAETDRGRRGGEGSPSTPSGDHFAEEDANEN